MHKERSCTDKGIQKRSGRKTRLLSWSTDRRDWIEMGLKTAQGRSLPDLPAFRKIRLTLEVWIPEECGSKQVSLRLGDAEGEVHQFTAPLPADRNGWQSLIYEVDASKLSKSCWSGTEHNKRLDIPVYLSGIAISFGDGKTGLLGLGNIRAEILEADFRVSVDTGDPLNLVTTGCVPKLMAANPTIRTKTADFEYVLTEPFGKEIRREKLTLELPPESTATAAVLPFPQKYGVYHVRWSTETVDLSSRPQTSYVYMRPAGPTSEPDKTFIFGMCDHLDRYPQSEQELIVLSAARCGIKLMRGSSCWTRVQPQPNTWDFSVMDGILDLLDRYGMVYEPIHLSCPRWAVAKDWEPAVEGRPGRGKLPDFDAWTTYAARFAKRYRNRIPYIVIWNEPDLHPFANFPSKDYVTLLKLAYEATKKNAPEILVKTAGFSSLNAPYPSRSAESKYMEKAIVGGKGYYDIFCIHLHGVAYRYHRYLQEMKEIRNRLGDNTPWSSNETGISSSGRISELNQAEILVKKLLTAWSQGAIGYSWYNMRMKGSDPDNGEHNYGIITRDFEPKPAYASYNMLANCFRNATFISTMGGNNYALMMFRDRHGDWLLPHWSWKNEHYDLIVNSVSGQAFMVDIFGNEKAVPAENGRILIKTSGTPGVLRISGQKDQPIPIGDATL
ncbi:MAG: beta-galactosidase [Kiritimatiellia bacterium]